MELDWKLMSKVRDAAVQDGCPDTVLANDGPAVDDLIAIRLEVVVAAAALVRDVEKMAMEAVVAEARLVHVIRLEVVVAAAALVRDVEKMAMEETVMEEVQAMRESLTQRQVNTAVQAIIRTFC
jgi:hypothetical protein